MNIGLRKSEKHFRTRLNKPILRSVSRNSSAPPSVLSCRSLKRALTCREKCGANANSFWLHSVIRKGRLFWDVNYAQQRSYARKAAFFLLLTFRGDSFSFTPVRNAG